MIRFDLAEFAAAVHRCAPRWERAGIRWTLTFGPEYDKPAAWVDCETGDSTGHLIVWTSGEAELDTADLTTGIVHPTHYDLTGPQELHTCLDELTNRLTGTV
ncbi:hypothetical protein GCM10022243_34570 [Saccharothrix violaceirubra]|uniref:Uncharacterized protein n=1 Tax=Saccharothrix violaceirubra TaxID=413306 RepID=A0A7W7T4M0_9PSEU|nr:hypothetical protein [Saccharothrix violaceirubra]MBB4966508.1 hypothetical protein [Saccharothrix violaceirubra]